MGVVKCELQSSIGGGINPEGEYNYRAVYHVTTNDQTDDWLVVQNGAELAGPDPLPSYMSMYALGGSADVSAFAQSINGQMIDKVGFKDGSSQVTGAKWEVTVDWTPLRPGKLPTATQTAFQSPLLRPMEFWSDFQTITEIVETDWDGNPIVNTAGQVFDEPLEEDDELEVFYFEKNYATAGEIRALNQTYRRKLNAEPYAGYPIHHCMCLPIRMSRPKYSNGTTYYTATGKIICSGKPWYREFVNRGFKHFADVDDGEGGTEKKLVTASDPVIDENNLVTGRTPVTEPVLLTDDSGGSGTEGYRLGDEVGNILTFRTRDEVSFLSPAFPFQVPT